MKLILSFLSLVILLSETNAGTVHTGMTASSSCGGNCPSGCSSCPCGTSVSYEDSVAWCSKYSWNQTNCQCIIKHESGGNANAAHQNSDGSLDVGLWQINDYNWPYCSGGSAPCDPTVNLNCAIGRIICILKLYS